MSASQDVSLLVDGQTFKAKKEMLTEYSDYFRAMFSGNYVEKEMQEISIDVVDANSMVLILRYMELGLIDLGEHSLSTIGDLAVAANFLQITELTKQIEYCLEQQLSLSNWIETMEIAQNGFSSKLEQISVAYGLFSFNSMKPEYIPSIQRLFWYLSHPYLDTESELHVFKFGLQWIQYSELGADALLIILCCLDYTKLKRKDLEEMRMLIQMYVNSLVVKIVDCLLKVSTDFEISASEIEENRTKLCEVFTEKVYKEVFNLVKETIKRKLQFTPVVPLWTYKESRPEASPHYVFTFTDTINQWLEVAERNLWGWNITAWGATKIVVVCGEHGRGTGSFMRDVKVYDIIKNEWIHHGVELPQRRHGGIAVVGDLLYIVGGVGGFRIVLDTAIVYDLKQRTFRNIAKLPDTVQCPAVCAHENSVYAAGHNFIYKYEDFGNRDRWYSILVTDLRPNCMVSYQGYIYVSQGFFNTLYRFRPLVDTRLEKVANFSNPPGTMCSLRNRLYAFTGASCGSSNTLSIEELTVAPSDPEEKQKIVWSDENSKYTVNSAAGSCSVVTTLPPVNTAISNYHKKYLSIYEGLTT